MGQSTVASLVLGRFAYHTFSMFVAIVRKERVNAVALPRAGGRGGGYVNVEGIKGVSELSLSSDTM
jgi:hypothetical protein